MNSLCFWNYWTFLLLSAQNKQTSIDVVFYISVKSARRAMLPCSNVIMSEFIVGVSVVHRLSSLSVHFVQVLVQNKHLFMEKLAACGDTHPQYRFSCYCGRFSCVSLQFSLSTSCALFYKIEIVFPCEISMFLKLLNFIFVSANVINSQIYNGKENSYWRAICWSYWQ